MKKPKNYEEAMAQLDEEPTSASLSISPVTPYSVEVLVYDSPYFSSVEVLGHQSSS